ncbi:MAG: enoyl-CoA hydratase-related protein [Xanthobacteraceae bacterium]|nr:enoyl-CoA hydratase-related protein [Xanthobacteraceae bacterium]
MFRSMAKPANQSPVAITRKDSVALVIIDNPPVNALSQAVRLGLLDAFRQLAADPEVAAIVVAGAGRDFIAGADLWKCRCRRSRRRCPM